MNPYRPTTQSPADDSAREPNSPLKQFLMGAAIGGAIPLALGSYGLYSFSAYAASLPPGEFVCGNAALGPFMLIVAGTPFGGFVGGSIALLFR